MNLVNEESTKEFDRLVSCLRQWVIAYVPEAVSIGAQVAIAGSTTLSFWFTMQYISTLGHQTFVLSAMAYIALITAYYGLGPLSEMIRDKMSWLMDRMLGVDRVVDVDQEAGNGEPSANDGSKDVSQSR